MRVLSIDDQTKQKVKAVLDYASNPQHYYLVGPDGLPKGDPPGNDPHCVVQLDTYQCVFSFTLSEKEMQVYRHLTVSVPGDKYPNPFAAYMIAELFGFTGWDGKSIELPQGWIADANRVDRCITLLQKLTLLSTHIPNCPNCHGERELNGSGGYRCFFCGLDSNT